MPSFGKPSPSPLEAGNQLPIGADLIARLIRGEAPEVRKALDAERDGLPSNDALTERLRKNREKAVEDSGGDTGQPQLVLPRGDHGIAKSRAATPSASRSLRASYRRSAMMWSVSGSSTTP